MIAKQILLFRPSFFVFQLSQWTWLSVQCREASGRWYGGSKEGRLIAASGGRGLLEDGGKPGIIMVFYVIMRYCRWGMMWIFL